MNAKCYFYVVFFASCVLLVNADGNTTVHPANITTTTEKYSTLSPASPNFCENLTMHLISGNDLFSSDTAVLECTCENQDEPALCPDLLINEEAKRKAITKITKNITGDGICSREWTINALETGFKRRRVEIPLLCKAGLNETDLQMLTFEKHTDQEACKEDVDCWSEDQICVNGTCKCYSDAPSFVRQTNKCYEASSYGQKCKYDEQCMSKDQKSICKDKVCKCQDNYWTKSKTDLTCTTSVASFQISSQMLVAAAVALSTMLLFSGAF